MHSHVEMYDCIHGVPLLKTEVFEQIIKPLWTKNYSPIELGLYIQRKLFKYKKKFIEKQVKNHEVESIQDVKISHKIALELMYYKVTLLLIKE